MRILCGKILEGGCVGGGVPDVILCGIAYVELPMWDCEAELSSGKSCGSQMRDKTVLFRS